MDKSFFPMMIQLVTVLSLIPLHSLLVIRNPCQASEGDNVTVSCALFVPNDDGIFTSIENYFIIGDVDDFIPKYIIDSNIMYKGIDLSRFIANAPFGNSKNVNGSITLLSYNSSTDKDLRMGCYNKIRPNGASMSYSYNKTLRIREKSNKRSASSPELCDPENIINLNDSSQQNMTGSTNLDTSVMQTPRFACEGEEINFSCVLTAPNGGEFTGLEISFNIDHVMNVFFRCKTDVCELTTINITRFMYTAPTESYTSVSGSITFIYNSSTDKDLHIGCMNLIRSETSASKPFILNHTVAGAAPPSAPSLQSSVSNFNTATCSADISLSWNTPPSNRTVDRYFLHLNGSPLATTNSSNSSYIHSTILNINTTYQYSVTAMSCAGNSSNSSVDIDSVASYSLMRSSQCLAYDNVTGLTVNWELSTPTQPSGVSGLDISYSLQLLYSHCRQSVTYTYTDSTSFTLPSSQLSYNTILTAHNFTQQDGVETNITANLMIVQQCGQSFIGTAVKCSLNPTPPSAPSLHSSLSNFNTATCSADISLSWNTPPSDRTVDRYFLYLDGSPLATTNSNSYIHSTILNINTDYQYSVTAMSCAGNSSNSSVDIDSFESYSLMRSSQCLAYYNATGLTVNWLLSTPTQPSGISGLDISYSLQLLYSHSRQDVTYTYTDSTSFTLPSSQLSYNTVLTAHNFTQLDGVETNITANLTIVQQCGQSYNGTAMECFFNSIPVTSTDSIGAIVGAIIGGCLFCVIILTTFLIILAICIFCSKKGTTKSYKPAHFGMEECDSISPTHKGPDQYSKAAETTNTNEEMNYAQIDHSMSKGSAVRPPAIPLTNYADIGSFPESTQYSTVNNPN